MYTQFHVTVFLHFSDIRACIFFMLGYFWTCTAFVDGSCWRTESRASVAAAINDTLKLRAQFPNDLLGFDVVFHEDAGHTLFYFIDELLYPSQIGVDLPYFFHAGETG